MGLITSSYAQQALSELSLTSGQLTHLDDAIDAASEAIERYCRRKFAQASYDEVYVPAFNGGVLLNQYPVNSVSRVSSGRTGAILIQNDGSAAHRATVAFSATGDYESGLTVTGVTLTRYQGATTTASALAFATYTTLTTLAAAINTLGSGWSAELRGDFGGWPTSDLVGGESAQGAMNGGCELDLFSEDMDAGNFTLNRKSGILHVRGRERRESFAFHDDTPELGEWGDVRVAYNAGYATIPAGLQDACVEAVKALLTGLPADPSIQSETGDKYSYTLRSDGAAGVRLTDAVCRMLAPYRDLRA